MMINKIPNSKFPIVIPLLRDYKKMLTLEGVTQYSSSRANGYAIQNGKSGFKVKFPNSDHGFLFSDIVTVLAQKIVDNKINLTEAKLEDTFHVLLKDTILNNGDHVYPYMYKYEVYYLAVADWWIKFSDI